LRFILKFLWHLERQNLNTVASLRTNVMPCPGYNALEQNQHFSTRMVPAAAVAAAPQRDYVVLPLRVPGDAAGCARSR
jgi:hypothetical protein